MAGKSNGSRIFLTELMFSIFFFIIVASICVQCFASGYVMSRQASDLTQAVNVASNTCEKFYGDPNFDNFTEYYDEDWRKTSEEYGVYKATGIVNSSVSFHSLETTLSFTITLVNKEEEIYSLKVKKGVALED